MTRRLLALLAGALLLGGVAATAPAPIAEASVARSVSPAPARGSGFNLRVGDGLVRLSVSGCHDCRTALIIEITIPRIVVRLAS